MQVSNSTPLFSTQNILRLPIHYPLGSKGRAVPRVVCCAIPIARAAGKVLVVTSRKQPNNWLCKSPLSLHHTVSEITFFSPHPVPKGGWEPSDVELEAAASREALEEGPNLYPSFVSPFPNYGLPPPLCHLFKQRAYEVPSPNMWSQYQRLQPQYIFMRWMSLASTTTG